MITFSSVGRRLARVVPLWALVAVRRSGCRSNWRHAVSERGIMPGVMSYSGRSFDIVTGAQRHRCRAADRHQPGGPAVVMVWNVVGLLLLTNVVIVAILATPAIRCQDQQLNVWVTYPPFVWLPAVMVLAALAGHLVIFRALHAPAGGDGR